MNILITGGAGFIGTNLARKLFKEGHSLRLYDNFSEQIHGSNSDSYRKQLVAEGFEVIKADICDRNALKSALSNIDVVVHYAAETGTGQSMYEIEKYTNTNVRGTGILLDLLANETNTVKKVIIASSRSIYGEGVYICENHGDVYPASRLEKDLLEADFNVKCPSCGNNVKLKKTPECALIHPSSIYGITKSTQEQLVMVACSSLKIPCVALRYQNVYGPGQSLKNPYTGILSIFSTRILNGNNLNIFEDGKETRDFVFIDDVVEATYSSIINKNADYCIFNVGSGEATDVYTIASELKVLFNSNIEINITGQFRLGDIRHNVADLKEINEKIGYFPKTDIKTGLSKFVHWVKGQAIEIDNYEKSIEEMQKKGLLK